MTYQLRMYKVKPGQLDEFITVWREQVVPVRRDKGFEIVGAWADREENRFVWVVGGEHFVQREREYYDSPEKAAMDPNPADYLEDVFTTLMEDVDI